MIEFAGRARELFEVQSILSPRRGKESVNVLVITGEPGIGKTSLAHALFDWRDARHGEFESKLATSAYMKSWLTLVTELARDLQLDLPAKASVDELERAILVAASARPILLMIDNVQEFGPGIIQFMGRWNRAGKSRLLITANNGLSQDAIGDLCAIYELRGIEEDFVITELLGHQMMASIAEWGMAESLSDLHGNPQKLLYIRWRRPGTLKEFRECIRELAEGGQGYKALEDVLKRIEYPIDHFLALGILRQTEIDAGLLAHLWDQLGLGGTELYSMSLQKLLQEGLLQVTAGSGLRLSAGIHVQLEKQLFNTLGKTQVNAIDYFVGEYYRRRFSSPVCGNRLADLDNYVYHMLRSGNAYSAYSYVFETGHFEAARSRGFSLDLERILDHFDRECDTWLSEGVPDVANGAARYGVAITIRTNMGLVRKDLSKYDQCLNAMDSAIDILESIPPNVADPVRKDRLRVTIDHYRGIAYSQTGRTVEAIEAYWNSIREAAAIAASAFGPLQALSLGYLAYELKFHNIEKSKRYARKAVELSRKLGDRDSLAKNLCSLGQILSFSGDLEESKALFGEAEDLCRQEPVDSRELGRVLVNSVVAYIAGREWKKVDDKLHEVAQLYGESGDRRRMVMGKAYRGICLFHQKNRKQAEEHLHEALQWHEDMGSTREMVYEALTLAWMFENSGNLNLPRVLEQTDLPSDVRKCVQAIVDGHHKVFADYWHKYYCPTLLKLEWHRS